MGQIIETDEIGQLIIPSDLLGSSKPKSRFLIEKTGEGLTINPDLPSEAGTLNQSAKLTAEDWLKQWREMAEEIGKVWLKDTSAEQVISEMRR